MIQLYPDNIFKKLEFDKILALLHKNCHTDLARNRVENIKVLKQFQQIEKALNQTKEMLVSIRSGDAFPSTSIPNLEKILKILKLNQARLSTEDLVSLKKLAENTKDIFHWFKGKDNLFPYLFAIIKDIQYEPSIIAIINKVLSDQNQILDNASDKLKKIRENLKKERENTRRIFNSYLKKLSQLGYLSEIGETFLNGRRCVAVSSEYKRIVKGILHGESDSGKTVFIEPKTTIEPNNEIVLLENEERKEIYKILRETTAQLSVYSDDIALYYRLCGLFDFIQAKATLARDMDADLPRLIPYPYIRLVDAKHPILYLKNKKENKETIPLNLELNKKSRVLIISGPNAGGKTIALKTVGLLQLMIQTGLLPPLNTQSEIGIFEKILIDIGDTQSIENELSTYSAHLKAMRYFLQEANKHTLFFIDEFGSGSDPYLGGTFAEAVLEQLMNTKAFGCITTHYLNLKIMAEKGNGMSNAAMLYNEQKLTPLYQMEIGKPGSSFTFAVAERNGFSKDIINRAKELSNSNHVQLEKLLLQLEKQALENKKLKKELKEQITQNKTSKEHYKDLADKTEHRRKAELLKLQNKIKKEEIEYLKETEKKFKQLIREWKKSKNKNEIIKAAEKLLFKKNKIVRKAKEEKKIQEKYDIINKTPEKGDLMLHKNNYQIGRLEKINNKSAIIIIGNLPFTIDLSEWTVVVEKTIEE